MEETTVADPYSKDHDGLALLQNLEKKGRLVGVAGDDLILLYYAQCLDCGGVIILNDRESYPRDIIERGCPMCNNLLLNTYPVKFVPEEDLDNYLVHSVVGKITLKERLEMGY